MSRSIRTAVSFALTCLTVLSACVQVSAPASSPTVAPTLSQAAVPTGSSTAPPDVTPSAAAASSVGLLALLADPEADHTTGDTARLSGGEFVGDQADLTVAEAVALPAADGVNRQYAFLVEITGLDPDTFPYNLRDFRLIDTQSFQYEPLFEGGQAPRLEFGDLSPEQRVRGWLTFEGPADTAVVQLQYSPALALEPATFGFLVP